MLQPFEFTTSYYQIKMLSLPRRCFYFKITLS